MKKVCSHFFLFLGIVCLNQNCIAQECCYVNNDSTDIFSTHPSRPFKYGYAYSSKEECEEHKTKLEYFQIKNGDIIADVGAASGWKDGVFSVLLDSVTFYVEDIDTNLLNQDQLNKVVQHYSSLRSTPQTNKFQMVIGTNEKTNLPDSLFDKIIIDNAFHEFLYPRKIIRDLTTKLKSGGQLIVADETSNVYKTIKHSGCNIPAKKASIIINRFCNFGFSLTAMSTPENSLDNCFSFEFNKEKGKEYEKKRKKVQFWINKLDSLNLYDVQSDSALTIERAKSIYPHIEDLLNVYPFLEKYLNTLGYRLIEDGDIKQAINVLRVNVILFPKSYNTYDSLAEAYLEDLNYKLSLQCYNNSLIFNPNNINAKEKIKEIYQFVQE